MPAIDNPREGKASFSVALEVRALEAVAEARGGQHREGHQKESQDPSAGSSGIVLVVAAVGSA